MTEMFSCPPSQSEDSDATVAPEHGGQEEEEFEGSMSPSILLPNSQVHGAAAAVSVLRIISPHDASKEVVSCSSEEVDEDEEEELSQEYMPLAPETRPGGREGRIPVAHTLADVEEQSTSDTIDQLYANQSHMESRLSEIEKKMKMVSKEHQEERKRLMETYTSLSQDGGLAGRNGEPLRSQLIILSAKHKKLLELFKVQKEMSDKLDQVREREKNGRQTVQVALPSRTSPISIPNLAKHLRQSSHHTQVTTPTFIATPPVEKNSIGTSSVPVVSHHHHQQQQPSHFNQAPAQGSTLPLQSSIGSSGVTSSSQISLSSQGSGPILQGSRPIPVVVQPTLVAPNSAVARSGPQKTTIQLPTGHPQQKTGAALSQGAEFVKPWGKVSSSELTHPVPLDVLIKHEILQPGMANLTCRILGCDFSGSLFEDGSIQEVYGKGSPLVSATTSTTNTAGCRHRQPHHWVKACWGHLGHAHKTVTKKLSYNTIFHRAKNLTHYCQLYSLKQVTTYLTHKQQKQKVNAGVSQSGVKERTPNANSNSSASTSLLPQPSSSRNMPAAGSTGLPSGDSDLASAVNRSSGPTGADISDFSQLPMELSQPLPRDVPPSSVTRTNDALVDSYLNTLLLNGEVLLVSERNHSLELPKGFWEVEHFTVCQQPSLISQIKYDLDW